MAYCTVDDVQKLIPLQTLIWLSNDAPGAREMDVAVINDAIEYAAREIERKISTRYQLPLTQANQDLTDIAVFIARHWLYSRRPEGRDLPEAVTRTFSLAIANLERIRDGKDGLPGAVAAGDQISQSAVSVRVNTRQRQFGSDVLGQY